MVKKTEQPSMYEDHQLRWNTHLQRLYLELEKRVQIEIIALDDTNDYITQYKILLLREQIHRLLCVVIMKDNIEDYIHLAINPDDDDIDLIDLSDKKLTTLNDLINYKVRIFKRDFVIKENGAVEYINPRFIEKYNIKELLNMARGPFSLLFSLLFADGKKDYSYPVLWGKSSSLSRFEQGIEEAPVFNVELYKHNRFNFFKEQIAGRLELYEENVRNNGSPDPFTKNVPG